MYQADFTKGWHSDFEYLTQPTGTYRRLVNGVRSLSGGIQSEPTSTPVLNIGGLSLLGWCELTGDLILFLTNGVDSQIGVLNPQDQYLPVLNSPELAFSLSNRVSAVAKKNFKGERVVYWADGLNPIRLLNLDSPPTQDIGDNLKLVTSSSLPIPQWLPEIEGGGSVPTGVYQVVARQLTRSTNPTSFGFVSEVLPVVEENRRVGRDLYDGALPQTPTSKALQVKFTNLDPDYPFLEVVIITYQGTGNQFTAYSLGPVGLNGRTEYTFTYRGASQHKGEVLLEELVTQPVRYESALVLTQKDGILVASNLRAKPKPIFSFQSFANGVTLSYTITEVEVTEFQDYKDELVSATLRGYRRGETYAFALSPTYQDYQDTTAYHIPAPAYTGTGTQTFGEVGCVDRANTSTKALGTYQSTEEYPFTGDYPTGKVRYHVMPTVEQEPLLVVRNGKTYLRILGIVADFTQTYPLLPEELTKDLTGFNILRLSRTREHTRVMAQGIANQHLTVTVTDTDSTTGISVTKSYVKALSPWAGHARQIATNGQTSNTITYLVQELGFFSPESTLLGEDFTGTQFVEAVTQMSGTQFVVAQSLSADNPTHGNKANKYWHLSLDYGEHLPVPTTGGPYGAPLVTQYAPEYIPTGGDRELANVAVNQHLLADNSAVYSAQGNGYLYLKTQVGTDLATRTYNGEQGETWYDDRSNQTDQVYMNGVTHGGEVVNTVAGDTQRLLYNLTRTLPSQYGKVEDASYHRIGTWKLAASQLTQPVFGGDTFIGKWSVMLYAPTFPVGARSLNSFWCESGVNVNYRHYLREKGTLGEEEYQVGTLPYYPKFQTLWSDNVNTPGIFNFSPALGHPTGYNKQYSFEDQLLSYFPKGITEEEVTEFPNRSIYSQQSVEGEQVDAYRQFLANDYQDIPKSRGPITQTFINGASFGWHTPQGLWKGFFNEQVSQAASNGEVYLGTGGVFTRPPVLIVEAEGGYAGCQGQWGISTPYGHFFPDTLQRKVFKLTPDWNLEDLTKQGIRKWADTHITPALDQPARGKGYTLAWDYQLDRLLVTKLTTPASS